jgi:hypothetical protein
MNNGDVANFFKSAANHWSLYVGALSIIGGVTMALLQTVKDLLPVRQWFQRRALMKWMVEGQTEVGSKLGAPVSAATAESDLLKLSVDGDAAALYDLQIEQLCGQFTAAIQMVLEFPQDHRDLLAITASNADADLLLLFQPRPVPPNPPVPADPRLTDARTRVTHQCQRAVDAFQISTGFDWKMALQIASFLMSAGLAWIALHYHQVNYPQAQYPDDPLHPSFFGVIVSAILAGFLAPVAKDLLAVLDKARGQ